MGIYLGAGALNNELADRQQAIREDIEGRRYGAERLREDVVGLGQTAINVGREYGYGGGGGRQHVASAKSMYDTGRQGEADQRSERLLVMNEQQSTINNLIKSIRLHDTQKTNRYYKGVKPETLMELYKDAKKDWYAAREMMGSLKLIQTFPTMYTEEVRREAEDTAKLWGGGEPTEQDDINKMNAIAAKTVSSHTQFFESNKLVDTDAMLVQSPYVEVLKNYMGEILGQPMPEVDNGPSKEFTKVKEDTENAKASTIATELQSVLEGGDTEKDNREETQSGEKVETKVVGGHPVIPVSLKASSKEAGTVLDEVVVERLKQDEDALAEKVQKNKLQQSYANAGEMGENFESVVQEIQGYDVGELKEAITLQKTKLAKAKWDKVGEPEQAMIKQTIAYLNYKLNPKKPQGVVADKPSLGGDYQGSPEWLQKGYEKEAGRFTGGVSTEPVPATVSEYTGRTDAGYSGQLGTLRAELKNLDTNQMSFIQKGVERRRINKEISKLEDKLDVAHGLSGPDTVTVKDDSWDADFSDTSTFQSPLQAKLKRHLIHTDNMIERNYNDAKQIDAQLAELRKYQSTSSGSSGFKNNVASLNKKRTKYIKQLKDWQTNRTRLIKDLNKAKAEYEKNVGDSGGTRNSMIDKTLELEGNGRVKSETAGGIGYPYKDGEYYALAGGLHVAQHMKNMSETDKKELAKDVYGSADTAQKTAFLNYLDMSLDQLREGKFKDDPNLRLTRTQRRVLTEFMWDESIEKMVKGNSFLKKSQGDTTLSEDIPPKLRHMMSDMAFRHGGGWLSTRDYFGFRVLLQDFLKAPFIKNKKRVTKKQAREALIKSFETTDRYEDEIVGKGRVRQSFLHGLLSDMRI